MRLLWSTSYAKQFLWIIVDGLNFIYSSRNILLWNNFFVSSILFAIEQLYLMLWYMGKLFCVEQQTILKVERELSLTFHQSNLNYSSITESKKERRQMSSVWIDLFFHQGGCRSFYSVKKVSNTEVFTKYLKTIEEVKFLRSDLGNVLI